MTVKTETMEVYSEWFLWDLWVKAADMRMM